MAPPAEGLEADKRADYDNVAVLTLCLLTLH
jgi:hypothetical protein